MQVAITRMPRHAACLWLMFLAGCATNSERIERLAAASGMSRTLVDTGTYRSVIYRSRQPPRAADALVVYFEGDGRPWHNGREPSVDPTTGNPLALKLLLQTPQGAAYVSRPCYQNVSAARCTPESWTSARYAEDIVTSMAEAVSLTVRQAAAKQVMLVGYSGGGTLAVLVAERLDNVAAVITVAANLDIDAWARHHGYLPLTGSLNPATSTRPHSWRELHLHGARDTVVPAATVAAYFARYPAARRRTLPDYDHACCWEENWARLWQQALVEIGPAPGSSD